MLEEVVLPGTGEWRERERLRNQRKRVCLSEGGQEGEREKKEVKWKQMLSHTYWSVWESV